MYEEKYFKKILVWKFFIYPAGVNIQAYKKFSIIIKFSSKTIKSVEQTFYFISSLVFEKMIKL